MTVSDLVNLMMDSRNASQQKIADRISVTKQAVQQRIVRDTWKVYDVAAIAEMLDYGFQITITDNKTGQKVCADILPPESNKLTYKRET